MRGDLRALVVGPDNRPDEQALISIGAFVLGNAFAALSLIWLHKDFSLTDYGLFTAGLGAHRAGMAWANRKEGDVPVQGGQ